MAEKRYKEINGIRYEVVPNPDTGSNVIPVSGSSDLPEIESGDGGKVLTVKEDESGTEWSDVSGFIALPSEPSDGDFLVYDSSASAWVAQSLSTWTAGSY